MHQTLQSSLQAAPAFHYHCSVKDGAKGQISQLPRGLNNKALPVGNTTASSEGCWHFDQQGKNVIQIEGVLRWLSCHFLPHITGVTAFALSLKVPHHPCPLSLRRHSTDPPHRIKGREMFAAKRPSEESPEALRPTRSLMVSWLQVLAGGCSCLSFCISLRCQLSELSSPSTRVSGWLISSRE